MWKVLTLATVLLFTLAACSRSETAMDDLPAAIDAPAKTWRVTGMQGQGVVFIVMDAATAGEKLAFQRAAATECPPTWCQAMFWIDGTDAPTGLPLTETQARTQVALYRRNNSTGLSKFTWRCDAFPGTPDSECYTTD